MYAPEPVLLVVPTILKYIFIMSSDSFSLWRLQLFLLLLRSSNTQQILPEALTKSQVDTDQMISPWLKPWIRAANIMEHSAKALGFPDKVEKERQDNLIGPSQSVFDFLKPKRKLEMSTTQKPMLQRLFDPFDFQAIRSYTTSTVVIPPKNDLFTNPLFFPKFAELQDTSSSSVKNTTVKPTTIIPSLLTLLESLGHNQRRGEEVEVGHDRTVNVLGMAVGRRDGISLAPLKGLSVGNEDMFGPVAVNDKYNINWGFFNDLTKVLNKPA